MRDYVYDKSRHVTDPSTPSIYAHYSYRPRIFSPIDTFACMHTYVLPIKNMTQPRVYMHPDPRPLPSTYAQRERIEP